MINDILTEILAAEQKAAEIRAAGEEKAAKTLDDGEKTCAELLKSSQEKIKAERLVLLKEYNEKAEAEYARLLEESVNAGKALANQKKGAAEKSAEEIYGRIINGDC